MRAAVAALTGFRPDQVVFQPNTSQGAHARDVRRSPAASRCRPPSSRASPSRPRARRGARRARAARWLETDHGRVTPGNLRDQLDALDRRRRREPRRLPHRLPRRPRGHPPGHRRPAADRRRHPGLRRRRRAVRGRRRRRRRAGRSGCAPAGAPASSRSATARVEHLTPVWSGFNATRRRGHARRRGARRRTRGAARSRSATPIRSRRRASPAALEEIAAVGRASDQRPRSPSGVSAIIDLADEFAHPGRLAARRRASAPASSCSSREPSSSPCSPPPCTTTASRDHRPRRHACASAPHASTDDETLAMLRAALARVPPRHARLSR